MTVLAIALACVVALLAYASLGVLAVWVAEHFWGCEDDPLLRGATVIVWPVLLGFGMFAAALWGLARFVQLLMRADRGPRREHLPRARARYSERTTIVRRDR